MNCPHCGSKLLWSEDRGAHCDGCDEFEELRLCVDHKLELWRRGYSSLEGIGALPSASPETCSVCQYYRRYNAQT